ncbi:TolC family protein [Mucilaginibacter sp. BJC16-A38]|uniref:TolC family protein n=1 Tax=Mucilaginibacter phenanthrenivorans TaxID=1234842 RepID=UPI00215723C6|nr:TolC family protein [Mucilaginibacter phenanthrenivorans]MCR8560106.1 TolC family protein [Mucilaginibacter phenanthrenivorans]
MDNIRFKILISCLCCLPLSALCQVKQKNNLPPVTQPDTSKNTLLIPFNPQDTGKNSSGQFLTLQQCIDYAMIHQPGVNKASINVSIAKETNGVNLAGWLPQATASGDLIHYLQTSSNGAAATTGTTTPTGASTTSSRTQYTNTFIPGIAVSQAIFSPSLLYAYKSAPLYLKQAQQVTDSTKIFLVSSVSKAFYNVLLTLEQINVLKEDTTRLGKNLRDAYHQYKGGIVDETDYEEAAISLNNSKAQLKQANENVVPQYAALKQLMGFELDKEFNVSFDTVQMIKGIYIDTTQQLQYEKRIEFQQVQTSKALQTQLVNYYRTSFLPTLSAFYNYNLAFESNKYSNLLSNSYPSQLIGLSFSIPIFTGFARVHNLQKAKLQEQVIGWDETDLKLQINKEYKTALANYKSNFYNLQLLQKNVAMAKRVYFVVTLQYKQGIVPYLNVITAESNLITSETSYLNALFQLLSSKIDLEKSMGTISY